MAASDQRKAAGKLLLSIFGGAQYTFSVHDGTEIVRSVRKGPPIHYLFEIDSFESFRNTLAAPNFDSTEFDVEGYRVLSIYPNGKQEDNGKDHISLYLKLVEKLGHGRSINATYKFFIYDYRRKIYLVVQELQVQHFDDIENEQGISRVLSLSNFTNTSNGFLMNDCCMFRVEVTTMNTIAQNACLRALNAQRDNTFSWPIQHFSKLNEDEYSDQFTMEGHSWKLLIHPRGFGSGKGKSLSMFLVLIDFSDLTNGRKLHARMELRLKNLRSGPHSSQIISAWYTRSFFSWGHDNVASLCDLHNLEKGFKIDDKLIVEVELKQLYLMKEN
ncbi:hypothetical protein Ancab_040562 [Ancistrocladus abbreviatus]